MSWSWPTQQSTKLWHQQSHGTSQQKFRPNPDPPLKHHCYDDMRRHKEPKSKHVRWSTVTSGVPPYISVITHTVTLWTSVLERNFRVTSLLGRSLILPSHTFKCSTLFSQLFSDQVRKAQQTLTSTTLLSGVALKYGHFTLSPIHWLPQLPLHFLHPSLKLQPDSNYPPLSWG